MDVDRFVGIDVQAGMFDLGFLREETKLFHQLRATAEQSLDGTPGDGVAAGFGAGENGFVDQEYIQLGITQL